MISHVYVKTCEFTILLSIIFLIKFKFRGHALKSIFSFVCRGYWGHSLTKFIIVDLEVGIKTVGAGG